MKKKSAYDIDKLCAKCENASVLSPAGDGLVLCSKKGIVKENYLCRNFRYDPLKRIPSPPKKIDPELSLMPMDDSLFYDKNKSEN